MKKNTDVEYWCDVTISTDKYTDNYSGVRMIVTDTFVNIWQSNGRVVSYPICNVQRITHVESSRK